MRYYDTKTKTETHVESNTTIVATDSRVKEFFRPLGNDEKLTYDSSNLPIITKYKLDDKGSMYSYYIDPMTPDFAKIKATETQAKTDNAYSTLQALCDAKSEDAKSYINGSKVTTEQLARYEEKYEMAQEFKADGSHEAQLQLEASLNNLSVTALADLIIAKGEAYRQALRAFNARIEAFRVKTSSLIANGEVDKAVRVLELAKDLGSLTTDADVKALFKGL